MSGSELLPTIINRNLCWNPGSLELNQSPDGNVDVRCRKAVQRKVGGLLSTTCPIAGIHQPCPLDGASCTTFNVTRSPEENSSSGSPTVIQDPDFLVDGLGELFSDEEGLEKDREE